MSVTSARGFVAAGVAAGIKPSGGLDLALVATDDGRPVPAAGVFTQNLMVAPPVTVSRSHLMITGGRAAGVVLNSGNANAATGQPGIVDATTMCELTGVGLGCDRSEVLVCSTGLIGIRLPMEVVEPAIPVALGALAVDGGADAARAIMTTDTFSKEVTVERDGFVLGGMAKGAAMLAPNMATMLAVLTTDALATPEELQDALGSAVEGSFNALTIDGCTSTNDTVLVLASGRAGAQAPGALEEAMAEACTYLAQEMAADAEGATKLVELVVVGARSDEEARAAARKVADSLLVKCSWYGGDPYWGRIASELGSAGVGFDQRLLAISYGGIVVCEGGVEVDHDRAAVARHMGGDRLHILCDLGIGSGQATVLTNDLTHEYVDENMRTS